MDATENKRDSPRNSLPWDMRRRGMRDSMRHDKRVREAIKKNLKGLIAEENIIASDGKRLVKIPLRYLDQYRFRHGSWGSGMGQGKGNVGDVIAREGDSANDSEGAGDQPGDAVYEAEISVEELTKMMVEDLALPWLEEKEENRQVSSTHYDFDDVRRKGSLANIDKKRTLLENLKRHAAHKEPRKVANFKGDDLRFKVFEIVEEYHSNAAVYLLMDRSGSMTTEKKYIAKSFFFWLVRFLRLKYETVEMVFIAHDTEAQIVPEKDFFTISNSGGTMCSSAYRVALDNILLKHPMLRWNTYVFHFSDGDNWDEDNPRCKELVIKLLEQTTMVGYGEIRYRDEASFYGWVKGFDPTWSTLNKTFQDGIKHPRFMTASIAKKEDVHECLKKFLTPMEESKK